MNIITKIRIIARKAFSLRRIGKQLKTQNENDLDAVKRRKDAWSCIQHWCRRRPFWGALCTLLASILMLWAPVCLLLNSRIPANTLWAGLVVGGVLFAMGLVELLAPSHALVAGAIGVVLSLVSLITVLGGFGIGMLLGVIGCCSALAWKPEKGKGRRLVFWSALGCSLVVMLSLVALVANGKVAVAGPMIGPFKSSVGRLECYNNHIVPAISRVDYRTPVTLTTSEYCNASNVVITQHVLGRTLRITQATHTPAISRGVTTEIVTSFTADGTAKDLTTQATNGIEQFIAHSVRINGVDQVLYQHLDSTTTPEVTVTFLP
jgi:MFS family permease